MAFFEVGGPVEIWATDATVELGENFGFFVWDVVLDSVISNHFGVWWLFQGPILLYTHNFLIFTPLMSTCTRFLIILLYIPF